MQAPIRYSVDQQDFDPAVGARLTVKLEGIEQADVCAYDIEAGTITRCKRSDDGQILVEGDEIVLETLTGVVNVEVKSEAR